MTNFEPHRVLRRTPPPRLYPARANRVVLEEPKPISQSLEWRLAARYWQHHGVAPFSDGSVPYIINNSGWAPRAAAEVLLAAGQSFEGPLIVVEVAAGSGIFARQALDHIQRACEEKGLDVYERLTWVATDGSARTVRAWEERGQFLAHQERVLLRTARAEHIQEMDLPTGTLVGVIANYALDSLPAEVLRRDGGRLHLQACVLGQESELSALLGMPLSEIRSLISSGNPEDLDVYCYRTGYNHQTCLLLSEQSEADFLLRYGSEELNVAYPG